MPLVEPWDHAGVSRPVGRTLDRYDTRVPTEYVRNSVLHALIDGGLSRDEVDAFLERVFVAAPTT